MHIKEYLRKEKIEFETIDFKYKCSKDINVPYPLCKRDQDINTNLD